MRDWPLSGDVCLITEIFDLVKTYKIDTIIETGTWKGRSAQIFSAMVKNVYTIEISELYYKEATYLNDYINIKRILGNSAEVLKEILRRNLGRVLFFLDAHWESYWPLLDELKEIASYDKNKIILCIHDFYNPHNEELGYDEYGGQRLDFEYIKSSIEKIFGINYSVRYPIDATGERRGSILIRGDIHG